jgi:hypothetical protein
MKRFLISFTSAAALLISLQPEPALGQNPLPIEVKYFRGISYMSGGFGYDERNAMTISGKGYSLKLILSTKKGDYLSDVEVRVEDGAGKEVLSALSEGPWFFAQLPPGDYVVNATALGKPQRKPLRVGGSGQAALHFIWNSN